ncbi:MAG: hypothetical protein O3C21_10770 [Verrucomicrobia bacterium]|nr:hypothetical protein [Verrucomicrobiota bacterium]
MGPIAQSGTGIVYHAQDRSLERDFGIKLAAPGLAFQPDST